MRAQVLSNVERRRRYDSRDDVEVKSVTDAAARRIQTDADFFALFTPFFESTARFSTSDTPMPSLGDATTPIDDVLAFYQAWYAFVSWRSFDELNEFTEDEIAASPFRDERRWMTRKNAAAQKGAKRAERKRVLDVVGLAERHDPRVRAAAAAEAEAKAAAKAARRQAKIDAARALAARAEAFEAAKAAKAAEEAAADAVAAADRKARNEAARQRRKRARRLLDIVRERRGAATTAASAGALKLDDDVLSFDEEMGDVVVDTLRVLGKGGEVSCARVS